MCGLDVQGHRGEEQPAGTLGLHTQVTKSCTEGKKHVCRLSQRNMGFRTHKGLQTMKNIQMPKKRTTWKQRAGWAALQNQKAAVK